MDPDITRIANGLQPEPWRKTYQHPIHGELTFGAQMPGARKLAAHAVHMDELLQGVGGARLSTSIFVAALSGLHTLIDLPVVREERSEDPESGHEVVRKIYYDPDAELDEGFLVRVWTDFSEWRESFLRRMDDLKVPSEATTGIASSAPSTESTDSPSTIPA